MSAASHFLWVVEKKPRDSDTMEVKGRESFKNIGQVYWKFLRGHVGYRLKMYTEINGISITDGFKRAVWWGKKLPGENYEERIWRWQGQTTLLWTLTIKGKRKTGK